jgi:hypothetical protein
MVTGVDQLGGVTEIEQADLELQSWLHDMHLHNLGDPFQVYVIFTVEGNGKTAP